ncbi:hypothetical protein OROGR_003669 [Orobanche gracilis]
MNHMNLVEILMDVSRWTSVFSSIVSRAFTLEVLSTGVAGNYNGALPEVSNNGVMRSIKPQPITFIVPGLENLDHTEISNFVQKAQENLEPALLEFAWIELLERNKSTTVEELAEMIFGSAEPLESYSAHMLLAKDVIYFTTLDTKGSYSIYGPRPAVQFSTSFPKYTSSAAQRNLKNFSQLTNKDKFETDKNLGLVKQVLASMYKRNIQRLTQTYLTLPSKILLLSSN